VYLAREIEARGVTGIGCATGDSEDPTALARRFSPRSNEVSLPPGDELRVLVATDLLSEGQNLQDAAIVVNYDLPWAIVRLVQRAGRVDRIGQRAATVVCYQIWNDSIAADPKLEDVVRRLQPVVYATREHRGDDTRPPGAVVFVRTAHDTDALAYVDEDGSTVTASPTEVLRLAACRVDTPGLPPRQDHHDLVRCAVERIVTDEATAGGQLGSRAGPRFKVYERLMRLAGARQGTLFAPQIQAALDAIYRHPLQATAAEALSRRLRAGIDDAALGDFAMLLHEEGRLCFTPEQADAGVREPVIVCSMGIR
jgi:hypothetical protein